MARTNRLTANLAREYARTWGAIQEVQEGLAGTRIVGCITANQEAAEEELARKELAERLAEELDEAWAWRYGDPYDDYFDREDYEHAEAVWRAEEAEEAHAYAVMRLARSIVRTQLTPASNA